MKDILRTFQLRILECVSNVKIMADLDLFTRKLLFDELRRGCMALLPSRMLNAEDQREKFFQSLRKKVVFKDAETLVRGASSLLFLFLTAAGSVHKKLPESKFDKIWSKEAELRIYTLNKEYTSLSVDHLETLSAQTSGIIKNVFFSPPSKSDLEFQLRKIAQRCTTAICAIRQAIVTRGKELLTLGLTKFAENKKLNKLYSNSKAQLGKNAFIY
jgi:hypothetical protein